jgi:hypothetical protein
MIRYLKHSEIDMKKWDACITASPNGIVYAFSWYLNIVAGEWEAFVEGDYISVFPVFPRRKFGISYSLQPLWTQQLGLFSTDLITPGKSQEFLELVIKKFRWIDMNLNSYQKLPDQHGFHIIDNNNFVLSLMPEYEQIASGYSENHKRNLKRNIDHLQVTTSVDHEEIVRMFRQNRGKHIQALDSKAYNTFHRLIYHVRSIQAGKIFGIYDDKNTLCAGAIFLFAKERAILLFSAINDEGRNHSAMHVLIDHFIRHHSGQHLILDFEGSNDENLARFYAGFGAENSPYMRVRNNRLLLPLSIVDRFRKLF